jgi:predicted RNase H-like HicB family nuclease
MSAKSKRSKTGKALAIDRPFAPTILAEARRIVADYEITLWFEDGVWYGHGVEFPTAYGDGSTVEECMASTREGLVAGVAYMLEKGARPPRPARLGERSEQVNIRLTAEERAMLENRSRAGGFRGLSDYVRTTALAESPATTATTATAGRPRRRTTRRGRRASVAK